VVFNAFLTLFGVEFVEMEQGTNRQPPCLLHIVTLPIHHNQYNHLAMGLFGKCKSIVGCRRPHKKRKVVVVEEEDPLLEEITVLVVAAEETEETAFELNEDEAAPDANNVLLQYSEFLDERSAPLLKEDCFRKAVAFLFVSEYNSQDNALQAWCGRGGIRKKIRDRLGISPQTKIDHILNDVLACKKAGISYEGERQVGDAKVGKRPHLAVDSVEAQIIADALESGGSIPTACWLANQHRKETGADSLCIAPVRSLVKRLDASVEKIKKRAQGSLLSTSVQARAKLGWNTQLLVRFGKLSDVALEGLKDEQGHLPDYYNLGLRDCTKLNECGTAWWDECHKKCTIGELGIQAEHHIKFRRDMNGKVDLKNGTYDDAEVHHVNVKYEQEVRQCFGCAMVNVLGTEEQQIVGKRARSFDYSGKTIISIKAENQNIKNECDRVRKLPRASGKWVYDPRAKGTVYADEPTGALPKIGTVLKKRLDSFGIMTVKAIKELTDFQIFEMSTAPANKIAASRLKTFRLLASTALPGRPPEIVDFLQFDNPYLAKYGEVESNCEPEWKHHIRKCSQMSQYVCVTQLVHHIVTESAKLFVGTEFEESWVFYHDALSLMTGNDTLEWMKDNDYFKRWVLPVNELHQNDPNLKKYYHRPVGNSPENMPWDSSLNEDVHAAVQRHVLLTLSLGVDDKRKFDMSTPKRGSSAYHRILEMVPCSERITHDVNKVFESMEIVRLALGVHCPGVGSRNYGVRHIKVEKKSSGGGGGLRKKKLNDYDDIVVHPDADYSVKMKTENSLSRAKGEKTERVGKWMKEGSAAESPKIEELAKQMTSGSTEKNTIQNVVTSK
jgi:hypothetical protein